MADIIYVGADKEYASLYDAALASVYDTVIMIDAGEYQENNQIELPRGVSIEGVGEVIIKTNYVASDAEDAFLMLHADRIAILEDGNQSVSNIIFDGENSGSICALVWGRNNVVFEDCTVKNFTDQGIQYKTRTSWNEPYDYAMGNSIESCVFRDCSQRTVLGQGAIWCHGQNGFIVKDCEFYLEDMPSGQNGNIMMMAWNKGFKYYDNVSWKSLDEGGVFNMGIEEWNSLGGNEIYNNTFNGGGLAIDIAGVSNTKGDYDYSWWIHHNNFILTEQGLSTSPVTAVSFEANNSDAIVSYNRIVNYGKAFVITQAAAAAHTTSNIKFIYNLCENIGQTDSPYGALITLWNDNENDIIENIYIYNNTFKAYGCNAGIRAVIYGTLSDIYIYNNIVEGIRFYDVAGSYFGWLKFEARRPPHLPVAIENVYIRNNIIYDNVNDNEIYYDSGVEAVVTDLVESDNIQDPPGYVDPYTDFNLLITSPAIKSGLYVGLTIDLNGELVENPPAIGCFEYLLVTTEIINGNSLVTKNSNESSEISQSEDRLSEVIKELDLDSIII